ncbi:MAG: PAS domain-containing protein, partial [Flavobacteriales bacterium]|nr:PAS domain-containing protein [Flavobacteriales bacterium]
MRIKFHNLIILLFLSFIGFGPAAEAKLRTQKETVDSLKQLFKLENENNLHPDYTIKILNELCWALRGSDPEEALRYGKQGLTMAKEYLNNSVEAKEVLVYKKSIATSLNNIGVVYDYKGDYKQALQFYLLALEKNEELGEKKQIAASLNNIGIIYYYLKDYLQTLKYYKLALTLREELSDEEGVAGSLNNIALVYINQVNETGDVTILDDAINNLEKSLAIKEKLGDQQGIAGAYGNIGNVYKFRAKYSRDAVDFAAAIEYNIRAREIFVEIGDKKGEAITLLDIADIHKMEKSYRTAIKYAKMSMTVAKEIGAKSEIQTANKLLAKAYEMQGDYKNALKYQLSFTKIKDSLMNQQTTQRIIELESEYQNKQHDKQNILLAKENEIMASEAKSQAILKNSLIITVLLLIVVSALIFMRYKEKKEGNLEMEKLSMVASKTDNYVIITDKFDRIEWVNDGFTRITGYTLQEAKDERPDILLRGALTDSQAEASIESKRRLGGPFSEEILNYNKSGDPIWLSLNVNPILNESGDIDRYITIGNDITEKKKS